MEQHRQLPDFLSHALAHFYLGELLEQTGKKPDAICEYQKFLGQFENPPRSYPMSPKRPRRPERLFA